jgi:hypothetical protein
MSEFEKLARLIRCFIEGFVLAAFIFVMGVAISGVLEALQ